MESSPFHIAWWMCYAIPKRILLQTPSCRAKKYEASMKQNSVRGKWHLNDENAGRTLRAGGQNKISGCAVVCVVRVIRQKNNVAYWRYWISRVEFNFISEKNATVQFLCVPLVFLLSYGLLCLLSSVIYFDFGCFYCQPSIVWSCHFHYRQLFIESCCWSWGVWCVASANM